MSEPSPLESPVSDTFLRRAAAFAMIYALVDFLILTVGGPFIFGRLVGVMVGFYAALDMEELREQGAEWGWTRWVLLILVAIGGFLGFLLYAWRRHAHLQTIENGESGPEEAASASDDTL